MSLSRSELHRLSTLWEASRLNQEARADIETQLQPIISSNINFSKEFIYQNCNNHALGIRFIPSSTAYSNYGRNITIDVLLSDAEREEMVRNITSTPPVSTFGVIRARTLVNNGLTEEQIRRLETEGFNTTDILETLHV